MSIMDLDEKVESLPTSKPSFRSVLWATLTNFVRSKPRLRASVDVARFVLRTGTGPVLVCPLCDEKHRFLLFGSPPRPNAACPSCGSLERHRLLGLYLKQFPQIVNGKDILHFAPEEAIKRCIHRQSPGHYLTADLEPKRGDIVLSIEDIALSDPFDVIIASHILEHVDDRVALKELYRTLRPGGVVVIMVPIVEGWASTYENDEIRTRAERLKHFGQEDHVRLYGRDLRERILEAGFELEEFAASPADCLSMGLTPGETIFLAKKP